jgi:hypothetical protein
MSQIALAFDGQQLELKYTQVIKDAQRFSEPYGRVATLPDLVGCFLNLNRIPNVRFITDSYVCTGINKHNQPVSVVFHGHKPNLPTSDTGNINNTWGTEKHISSADFQKLADGEFGEVNVVDIGEVKIQDGSRCRYDHGGHMYQEETGNALYKAVLGPNAVQFLTHFGDGNHFILQSLLSVEFYQRQLQMISDGKRNPFYFDNYRDIPIKPIIIRTRGYFDRLVTELAYYCPDEVRNSNYVIVGVTGNDPIDKIVRSFDSITTEQLIKYWSSFTKEYIPTSSEEKVYRMVKIDGQLFTSDEFGKPFRQAIEVTEKGTFTWHVEGDRKLDIEDYQKMTSMAPGANALRIVRTETAFSGYDSAFDCYYVRNRTYTFELFEVTLANQCLIGKSDVLANPIDYINRLESSGLPVYY